MPVVEALKEQHCYCAQDYSRELKEMQAQPSTAGKLQSILLLVAGSEAISVLFHTLSFLWTACSGHEPGSI